MLAIDEVVFPTQVSYGSRGGPGWKTEVVELATGYERRNGLWANQRAKYDAKYGVRNATDLSNVRSFFNARRGKLRGFRYLDWLDGSSRGPVSLGWGPTDQVIGHGDGATTTFQLVRTYQTTSDPAPYIRPILKPIAVTIALNGTTLTSGWSCNLTTGLVTIASAPLTGATMTAGFIFHVPVRFDIDDLDVSMSHFNAGEIPSIPMVELKL